jgi:hypothetical protein
MIIVIIIIRRDACITDFVNVLPALKAINSMTVWSLTKNIILFSCGFPGLPFSTD